MSNNLNPHIHLKIIPQSAAPDEACDAEFVFSHSELDAATFTLKVKVVNSNYDSEIYSQTEQYSPNGNHHRIANYKAPSIPGAYEVIASVLSSSGEELESSKDILLVVP
jgi:hypothetical protein